MTNIDPIHAWTTIAGLLPADFRELANEHKQIQTQFGNAKITSADELLRFIFAHVLSEASLRHTVAAIEAAGGPRLSHMRLHMKLRHAAPYLHHLLRRLVPESYGIDEETVSGAEFVAIDATDVVGPGSTCSPARVHLAIRLHDLRISAVSVSDATEQDGLRRFFWTLGQVIVADAAQTTASSIGRVRAQGADVLLYGADDAITAGVDGRFVRWSDGDSSMGGAGIFTSLPIDTFPAERLFEIHAITRLALERTAGWKANHRSARLPTQREDTMLSWLYAKMVLGILQEKHNA